MKPEAAVRAAVGLPCGRTLEFDIRRSRVRNVYFRMCPRAGLLVTAPRRMSHREVLESVARKSRWISNRLSEFEAVGQLIGPGAAAVRPEAFDLPALAETWRVEYKSKVGSRKSEVLNTVARAVEPGRLVVSGAIDDVAAVARRLIDSLVTTAPPRDREEWAARAKARAAERFAGANRRG